MTSPDNDTPLVADDEPAIIPADAEEQRPVLPKGRYIGKLTRWEQKVLTFETQKGGEQSVRFDDISVSVTDPELGIQFAGTSPFDRRYNTSYESNSGSSAAKFRKACSTEGMTNAQLAEIVKGEPEVVIDVVNVQRKDKKNLTDEGKPTVIVEALISSIQWKPQEA
jgi:hypothetical protein